MEEINELGLDSLPDDSPEETTNSQSTPGPRKRVYQSRRNSRACDACRARKTKCDASTTRICRSCTSCTSASLLCRFTEPGNGKKIGPLRRLQMLEKTIEELNDRLKLAEVKLQSPSVSQVGSHSTDEKPPHSPTAQQPRRLSSNSSRDAIFPGSNSTQFMDSVQGYMNGLGYDTSLLDTRGPNEGKLQSTNTTLHGETLQIRDLRALLPTKENGEKLVTIFYQHLRRLGQMNNIKYKFSVESSSDIGTNVSYRYMPAMCWPVIYKKFQRAYEAPILAEDRPSVTGVFCVLMTINACASICSDNSDVFEVPNYSSKRGWYFLELARNFHDLRQPNHSLFDVEVLAIMAMYLEVVALLYPLRLTVEYLVRVCKDLQLHRKPAYEKFNLRPMESEHRSRMFWCTFLLDRKLALQLGTTPMFDEKEIEINEPGSYETSDLVKRESNIADPEGPESIMLMKSLIGVSRLIGQIFRLNPQEGSIEHQVVVIEQQLGDIENSFPQHILDWESSSPLDPMFLDAAMFAMATRLSLYRYFTDATLTPDFRARCFLQCLEVAKATVQLLRRTMKFPDSEKAFRLRQSGLTYQHIFKASTILLLAASILPNPENISSELRTCIGVLQVAAPVRPSVLQNLRILDKLSEILKQEPILEWNEGPKTSDSATFPPPDNMRDQDHPSDMII